MMKFKDFVKLTSEQRSASTKPNFRSLAEATNASNKEAQMMVEQANNTKDVQQPTSNCQ